MPWTLSTTPPTPEGRPIPRSTRRASPRKRFVLGGAAAGAAIGLGAAGTALGGGKAPATPKAHTNNPNREFEGLVLTKGKIHTMDGSRRVVEEVADQERPLPRGRQPRRPAPVLQGVEPEGAHGDPGDHRRAQPHRSRRQPAGLAHRARARVHDPGRDRGDAGVERQRSAGRVHHDDRPDLGDAARRAALCRT